MHLWLLILICPAVLPVVETVERATANALEAKKAWLEAALEEGLEIHEPVCLG